MPLDGLSHNGVGPHVVVGKLGWAQEGDFCTQAMGDLGDLRVVSRDHDTVEQAALAGGIDGVCDDRPAGKRPDILARNALATASGWYDA